MAASSRGQKQIRTAEGAKDDGGMDREAQLGPVSPVPRSSQETARPT